MASSTGTRPSALRTLRFALNTFYSGPQAWFFVAADQGYFAEEGLELHFSEGDTLANVVPRLADGLFDAGYGDMNALVELAAVRPHDAPVAVFAMHNRSPYTIAVPSSGPVKGPLDLAGRRLVTHPNDAAWRLFAEFGAATGLNISRVGIEVDAAPHRELIPQVLAGRWDGIFGFVNTLRAQALEAGIAPDAALRHLEWREHVPALYGAAVMVTPTLLREEPDTVSGLLRAVNRGLHDVVADPAAAIDAVVRRNPALDRAANLARLSGTLALEMAHPEGARLGLGEVDDLRLAEAVRLIANAKGLATPPSVDRVFDRRWLPPLSQRVRLLVGAR